MNLQRPVQPGQPDHYHELNIKPDATSSDIRKAYLNLSRQHHPDKLAPDASDAKFKRIKNAYDTLSDPVARGAYDKAFLAIRREWIRYDREFSHWVQGMKRQREEAESRRQADEQARERRRAAKAQYNKEWRERKRQEKAAQDAEERKKREQEEEEAQRRTTEQVCEEQIAANERLRRQRWLEAELRTRQAQEQAHRQREKAAGERLRRIQEQEAQTRMHEIAKISREEAAIEEQKRREEEQAAIEQWEAAVRKAQERDAFRKARVEQQSAAQQQEIADKWLKANLRRQNDNDNDIKPDINDLQSDNNRSSSTIMEREMQAAERFAQEIMHIRGETKSAILKDVVLITLEMIDREIAVQKHTSKRKASVLREDPARLPSLVTEIFAKMETGGDSNERFRFSKKPKHS